MSFSRVHRDASSFPEFSINGLVVAKRKHTPRPGWGRAIRSLMSSSRHLRTQTALARKSGVASSTISRILREEVDPQSDNLERLALSFGMSYSTLAAIAEGVESAETAAWNAESHKLPRRVPLLSFAQAGSLAESLNPDHLGEVTDWIELPKKRYGPRAIALKVSGESMEPDYRNGDIIYIDPDVAPLHGKDVVVRHGERNEVAFKRLVIEGDRRYLKPLNQNWPDKFISISTDAQIVGVVVGRYTDL
jgi:phage repressor protein C with HTH and peptisase S24 domain